jgi:hypothetical protein
MPEEDKSLCLYKNLQLQLTEFAPGCSRWRETRRRYDLCWRGFDIDSSNFSAAPTDLPKIRPVPRAAEVRCGNFSFRAQNPPKQLNLPLTEPRGARSGRHRRFNDPLRQFLDGAPKHEKP